MTSPQLTQTATTALAELLEVSPQVDAAVVFERSSASLLGYAPSHAEGRARRFTQLATKILDAADKARTELGREPVTQCEVATGDGHVFVVSDGAHAVAAVTATDPTVGLVFYDLKTALRAVRDASHAAPVTSVGDDAVVDSAPEAPTTEAAAPDTGSDDAASASVSSGLFRRRKS